MIALEDDFKVEISKTYNIFSSTQEELKASAFLKRLKTTAGKRTSMEDDLGKLLPRST